MTTEQFFEAIRENLEAAMARRRRGLAGDRLGDRTRSRLMPRPMSRPGIRRSSGKRSSIRTMHGARRERRAAEQAADDRSCAVIWPAWMIRVGSSRRSWTLCSSASTCSPRAIGPARMLAAATASWIARLMPIPPIGDMAWAASPIASRPGRCQRVSRSSFDRQQMEIVDRSSQFAREVDIRKRLRHLARGSSRCPAPDLPRPCPWG